MININMGCAVIVDDDVFFSALDFNALFKMNLLSGKTEYICKFEKEKGLSQLHIKAFRYGNQIWFIPLFGEYIISFNTDENKINYFDIPKKVEGKMGIADFWLHTRTGNLRPKFFDAGKIDDERLYLVPATSDAVIILDMKKGSLKAYYGVIDVKQEFIGSSTLCGNKLWMAPYMGSQLIGVDIESGDVERVECPSELGSYFGICSFENKIWFSPQNEKWSLFYDIALKKFEYIRIENKELRDRIQVCEHKYRDAVLFRENIWFLPADSETIICMDPISEKSSRLYLPKDCDFGVLIGLEIYEDKLFILSYSRGYLMSIDNNKKLTVLKGASIDENEFYKILNGELLREFYYQFLNTVPEDKLGLQNYIRIVTNEQC